MLPGVIAGRVLLSMKCPALASSIEPRTRRLHDPRPFDDLAAHDVAELVRGVSDDVELEQGR